MQDEITIFLTPPEALLFKDFQEYHNTFTLMCQKGVFAIKNGSCQIHFDSKGTIRKIERHDSLFDSSVKSVLKPYID